MQPSTLLCPEFRIGESKKKYFFSVTRCFGMLASAESLTGPLCIARVGDIGALGRVLAKGQFCPVSQIPGPLLPLLPLYFQMITNITHVLTLLTCLCRRICQTLVLFADEPQGDFQPVSFWCGPKWIWRGNSKPPGLLLGFGPFFCSSFSVKMPSNFAFSNFSFSFHANLFSSSRCFLVWPQLKQSRNSGTLPEKKKTKKNKTEW